MTDTRDKIIIRDLLVQAIVGVNKGERKKKQNICMNITMFTNIEECGRTDDISKTLDYSPVVQTIISYVENSKHYTIEALSTGIARICCLDFNVPEVIIRVDKPSALFLAKAPGVKIRRTREFFLKAENIHEPTKQSSQIVKSIQDGRHTTYLAIGSNIGDRLKNIHLAFTMLKQFCTIEETSFLYETPPAYVVDQPSFLNAACKVLTELSPQDLLKKLKEIEENMGREKTIRFGPRNIDLDIIFYEDAILKLSSPDLIIPHPRVQERDFVLGPLADIAEDFIHPVMKLTIKDLLKKLPEVKLKKVFPINERTLWRLEERTLIMGILNATPDSFSDGGKFNSIETAVSFAKEMVENGVDIIDIGGQSTRPGAEQITFEEELSRVIPILKAIRKEGINIPISVDTFYSQVAKEAVACGADLVNDVTGGSFDNNMFSTCAETGVPLVITHSRGNAKTMGSLAQYTDVVGEVKTNLKERVKEAQSKGLYRWHIVLDPGIGFAKNQDHNLELLRSGSKLLDLGFPLLYGTSRKGFIGNITKQSEPAKRAFGTAATCTASIQQGASIVRVHDVKEMRDVVLISDAIYRPKPIKF